MKSFLDVLQTGTRNEIEEFKCPDCGSHIYYDFEDNEGNMSMTAGCNCKKAVLDKIDKTPNCVEFYGYSHDFENE